MKAPKDRPMTPLLAKQLKKQQRRIKQCGTDAYINHHMYDIAEEQGTYFSHRFKRAYGIKEGEPIVCISYKGVVGLPSNDIVIKQFIKNEYI